MRSTRAPYSQGRACGNTPSPKRATWNETLAPTPLTNPQTNGRAEMKNTKQHTTRTTLQASDKAMRYTILAQNATAQRLTQRLQPQLCV